MAAAFEYVKPSNNDERLSYTLVSLVGEVVAVHLCDGNIVEGLFASKDENECGLRIVLLGARFRPSPKSGTTMASSAGVKQRLLIEAGDVVMVECDKSPLRMATAARGNVGHHSGMGEMKRWADMDEGDEALESLDAGGHKEGSWDQFETNKQKFGVQSSYSMDHYTTKLDPKKVTPEMQQRAAALEREINQGQTRGVQHELERGGKMNVDEGAAFSDVARPAPQPLPAASSNAYVPPSKRKNQADGAIKPVAAAQPGGQPKETSEPSSPAPATAAVTSKPAQQHVDPTASAAATAAQQRAALNATAQEWRPTADPEGEPPVEDEHSVEAEEEDTDAGAELFLTMVGLKVAEKHAESLKDPSRAAGLCPSREWPADDMYPEDDTRQPMQQMGGGMAPGMGGGTVYNPNMNPGPGYYPNQGGMPPTQSNPGYGPGTGGPGMPNNFGGGHQQGGSYNPNNMNAAYNTMGGGMTNPSMGGNGYGGNVPMNANSGGYAAGGMGGGMPQRGMQRGGHLPQGGPMPGPDQYPPQQTYNSGPSSPPGGPGPSGPPPMSRGRAPNSFNQPHGQPQLPPQDVQAAPAPAPKRGMGRGRGTAPPQSGAHHSPEPQDNGPSHPVGGNVARRGRGAR